MAEKTITLPWPDKDLASNSRANRFARARKTRDARNMAWAVSMEAPRIKKMPGAHIFVEYYPKTFRGDVQNVPASLKAYIDGIADAMGCDDRGFKVDYPTQWAGKSDPAKVVFRVVPSAAELVELREVIS